MTENAEPMRVYLASMYQWMERMKVEREKFIAAGFDVTSQWIDGDEEKQLSRHDAACMDLFDVDRAEIFVLFTLDKGTMFSSGGRMVELGYAMARGKAVFIIGDRENVFCHHDSITVCKDVDDALVKVGLYRAAVQSRMLAELNKLHAALDAKFADDSDKIRQHNEEQGFVRPGNLI